MDQKEELEICSHCNKEVAKTNLSMHEAHCQRFLCLCPDCDEQVKCKQCNMKMEKCKLPDHEENECTERIQSCDYCQLNQPLSKLKEHVVVCGSRTEHCEDCNQYVMLKDQLQHAQICPSDDFSFKSKAINWNVKTLPMNSLQVHETCTHTLLGNSVADSLTDQSVNVDTDSEPEDTILSLSDLHLMKQNEKMGWNDEDQISTCPHCHLALPVNTLQWHQDKCSLAEVLKRLIKAENACVKK